MNLSEKYSKTILNNSVYKTVLLTDIVQIENEKYLIFSGYLFDKENEVGENEKTSSIFYKRNVQENQSEIDAYYLIYNMDTNEEIEDKQNFIQKYDLATKIRLDKTKCEQIELAENKVGYSISVKGGKYIFAETENKIAPYLIMKEQNNTIQMEKIISFNTENSNAQVIEYNIKTVEEMQKEIEKVDSNKLFVDAKKFYQKIIEVKQKNEE